MSDDYWADDSGAATAVSWAEMKGAKRVAEKDDDWVGTLAVERAFGWAGCWAGATDAPRVSATVWHLVGPSEELWVAVSAAVSAGARAVSTAENWVLPRVAGWVVPWATPKDGPKARRKAAHSACDWAGPWGVCLADGSAGKSGAVLVCSSVAALAGARAAERVALSGNLSAVC